MSLNRTGETGVFTDAAITGDRWDRQEVSASIPAAASARNRRRVRILFLGMVVGPYCAGGDGDVCAEAVLAFVRSRSRAASPSRARLLFASARKIAWYSSRAGPFIPRYR